MSMRELMFDEISEVTGAGFWEDLSTWGGAGATVGTLVGAVLGYGESQAVVLSLAGAGAIIGVGAAGSFYFGYQLGSWMYNQWCG